VLLGDAITPDLVEEIDDDLVFLYAKPIEVLAHNAGKLFSALTP
jgi:hypothetical protein